MAKTPTLESPRLPVSPSRARPLSLFAVSPCLTMVFLLLASSAAASPSPLPPPPKSLVITSGHIVLEHQAGTLRVMEMLTLENQADEVYEGISMGPRTKISLRFPVPEGAGALAALPESGPGLVPVGVGFGYTQPLAPGKKMLAYTYELPLFEGRIRFPKFYRYPVRDLSILARVTTLRLAITGAHEAETVSLEGQTYQRFHVDSLGPDEEIMIEAEALSGPGDSMREPRGSRSASASGPKFPSPAWGIIGAFSAIALLIGAYLVGYAKGRTSAVEPPDPDELRRELVAEIAVLDDRHDNGSLADDEWKKKRENLRAKLTVLIRGSTL